MAKNPRWPDEATLKKVRKILARGMWSSALPENATPTERFKFDLCQRILAHKQDHRLSQRQMAELLDIHESRVSEILHMKIRKASAEKLMSYVEKLDKKVTFKVA